MLSVLTKGTANKRFLDNKKRFIKGEDYFVVSNSEIWKSHIMPFSDSDFTDKVLILRFDDAVEYVKNWKPFIEEHNAQIIFQDGNILAIKGARTIAEYVIRKWIQDNNFDMEWFHLEMSGDEGILIDRSGDTLHLQYDKHSKKVIVL